MKRKISIDAGKGFTKTAIARKDEQGKKIVKTYKFASKITENVDERDILSGNSYMVQFEGVNYTVGEIGTRTTEAESSKKNIIHKICAMTAIASLVDNGDSVDVIIGIPASIYNNSSEREAFKNYILPSGRHTVKIKQGSGAFVTKEFEIDKVMVIMEGAGVALINASDFSDDIVGIIDIGNWNTNMLIFKNLVPEMNSLSTDANGCRSFIQKLTNSINSAINTDLKTDEVEMKLRKPKERRFFVSPSVEGSKEKSITAINDSITKYIQSICDAAAQKWNLANTTTYFIGGTSNLLRTEIMEYMASKYGTEPVIPNDAEFVNVIGALKMIDP